MEDGEDEIMDPEDGMDGGMDDEGEGDGGQAEYVKKEYFARPYKSPYNTEEEVEKFKIKNSR